MGRQMSIDESLIPFKGRLSYRQYIPSKRARFGIKCWVLTDASNSFVSRFFTYTLIPRCCDLHADPEGPLSSRFVHQLVDGLENLNHQHYVDNFYTSLSLFWLLLQVIGLDRNVGSECARAHLQSQGVHMQRRRVRAAMKRIDPAGVVIRALQPILQRRTYAVRNSNCWADLNGNFWKKMLCQQNSCINLKLRTVLMCHMLSHD